LTTSTAAFRIVRFSSGSSELFSPQVPMTISPLTPSLTSASWTRWGAELMEVASRLGVAPAGGLRFENSGQISDPGLAMRTLREAFEALGGETRSARIKALGAENGRAVLTLENGEVLRPDQVVLAAGVGSGALMRGLGHVAPIVAERGYHIEGDVGAWGDLPPVVFEDRSMIVTRFGDRLRAASFVEFARRDTPADPRKWARLHRHVDELGLP
jgi:glycine/D-amino acid oxidase-like deaminating enzyme